MDITAVISSFLTHVKVEKGLSPNTVTAYQRDLAKFNVFAQKRKLTLEKVSRDDLVDFLAGLYRDNLESKSVARHLVTLRNFFRHRIPNDAAGHALNMWQEVVESLVFALSAAHRKLLSRPLTRLARSPQRTTTSTRDPATAGFLLRSRAESHQEKAACAQVLGEVMLFPP